MFDKISIIVPIYKVEKYLNCCVDSILNQSYSNIEVILVDDGSPDNCPIICETYASKDKRVRVIHKENGGQASARNMALDCMTGDWVMFIDSDDEVDKHMAEHLLTYALKEHCDIVRCTCLKKSENTSEKWELPIKGGVYHKDIINDLIMRDVLGSQPCFAIYKSSLWNNIRFPEGRIYEDLAVIFKVYMANDNAVGVIDEPLYVYNLHNDSTSFSISANKNYDRFLAFKERWEYAKDHNLSCGDYCFSLAFKTAIGTINYYLKYKQNRLSKEKIHDVILFINLHKKTILNSPYTNIYYAFLFRLFYINERLYEKVMNLLLLCNRLLKIKIMKRRESNFELLRLIAMFLVLLLHCNYSVIGNVTQSEINFNPLFSFITVP